VSFPVSGSSLLGGGSSTNAGDSASGGVCACALPELKQMTHASATQAAARLSTCHIRILKPGSVRAPRRLSGMAGCFHDPNVRRNMLSY
jgi:hypothetical protein